MTDLASVSSPLAIIMSMRLSIRAYNSSRGRSNPTFIIRKGRSTFWFFLKLENGCPVEIQTSKARKTRCVF